MADIRMIKYHSLPMPAARALVQQAADDLAEEYDLTSRWAGNTLHFSRSGVQGHMEVTGSEIRLEVTLGFLLSMFKAKFVENIEHNFETLLTKAHAAHRPAAKSKTTARDGARTRPATRAAKKTARKG